MSFDIFPKYGQNFIIKIQQICLLTFCWLEIMARNYIFWKNFWNFEPKYLLWPSLPHNLLWFFWKSFGSTFIPWKKVCVQAMAWGWAVAQKSIFVPNVCLYITHNGIGLRSDIRSGGFLASSNIVLKVSEEKTMCSSGNEAAEDLEVALFSHNFTLKFSLATVCFYLATAKLEILFGYLNLLIVITDILTHG